MRIKDYTPGDDTRRIHWVRSLVKDQLVVRLPDEVPRDEPSVRLVLDTHLEGMALLSCPAADELLDAMVRIWLGIGKELSQAGTQVTLVTAAPKGDTIQPVEQKLAPRLTKRVLELGARVAWQPVIPVGELVKGTTRTIVVSCRPHISAHDVCWVVVPEPAWTSAVEWALTKQPPWMKLAYPTGSPENRKVRRDAERDRMIAIWDDRWRFSGMVGAIDWRQCQGEYVALPKQGTRVSLEVIP